MDIKRLSLILLAALLGIAAGTAREYRVSRNISSADGLSNNFVVCMAIDGDGYVWVGTRSGVSRIAGKTCRPLPELDALIDNRSIMSLHWYDEGGLMLIGMEQGMVAYRPSDGRIRHLSQSDGLVKSSVNSIADGDGGVWIAYGNGSVQMLDCRTFQVQDLKLDNKFRNRCVAADARGHLYIGHSQNGMTVVNLADGKSKNYVERKGDASSLPGNNVRSICIDNEQRVWVGTDNGVARFDLETGTFAKVTDASKKYDDNVFNVSLMRDGRIWIANDIGGVKMFNPDKVSADGGLYFDDDVARLSSLNSRSVIEDEYGNIWVGSYSAGIDFISSAKQDFSFLDYRLADGRRAPIYAMADDDASGIWLATESELTLWDGDDLKGRWNNLEGTRREYASPRCMMVASDGSVWLGLDDQGVYRFDRKTGKFTHIPIEPDVADIHSFTEMSDGSIWIGTEYGVFRYANGEVTSQDFINRNLHAPASSIIPIGEQRLFIATYGDGIHSFDLLTKTCRFLSVNEGLPSGKINHVVRGGRSANATAANAAGVWLATDAGLAYVADPVGLTGLSVYGKEQGLADGHIVALQQDDEGRIWMSTYSGISCFVKNTGRFYNYDPIETRQLGGFSAGAAVTANDGTICFGTATGVIRINPQLMGSRSALSDVQIISTEAYNQIEGRAASRLITPDLHGCIHSTYRNNTLRIAFTVRNFAQTEQVDYSYKLEGSDDKWYDVGRDNDIVFRALRPGHYTLVLRAKLRSQDWLQSKHTRLDIDIAPPFWQTWWAKVIYFVLGVFILIAGAYLYKRKLTQRNALEIERRENLQMRHLNEERLRFFTNVAHELRTPLTLILGPLDDLMNDTQLPQTSRRRVAMIHKSAERLRSLISELLEFRKTETQNRQLIVARGDIGHFVKDIFLNYKALNRNPKVEFACYVADNLPEVWFDSEVITTVLNNFLSNAVKYTEQGNITTSVMTDDRGHIVIRVADTGCGISRDALPHIFERYYQAKGIHQASGTGIGLALVKSLADLHEGQVGVESREGEGSTFALALDIANNYPNALHKEDVAEEPKPEEADEATDGDTANAEEVLPQLLVVEDNADIRQYIYDSFCDDYRIIQAENGEEGLRMAREQMPDIIVSDIMMPRMDGIELTRHLKEDIRTSHIPIILLTAKNTDDDKEVGYDSGADSYLTKPFTVKLLASRIRNLLASRRRLAEFVANGGSSTTVVNDVTNDEATEAGPSSAQPAASATGIELSLSRIDREFIERLNSLIEENIMKESIDMAFVTDKMAMSHSTFYRKVKALTGLTANEYIRKRRLLHCYNLLRSGEYNVSQAAMMTGFNQMAHFREIFKHEFGMLPSEVNGK